VNTSFDAIAQTETVTSIYNLEGKTPEAHKIKDQKHIKILKLVNSQRFKKDDFILGKTLQEAIETNKLTIYRDKKCTKPYAADDVIEALAFEGVDTIITFDPETFAKQPKAVRYEWELFPNEESVYEVSQKFTFDDKKAKLKGQITNFHLSYLRIDDRGDTQPLSERTHTFSFKNTDKNIKNAAKELQQNNIIWAKQIDYNITFQNENIRENLLSEAHLKANKLVSMRDRKSPVSSKDLKLFTEPISYALDTIIAFDPNTFAEEIKITSTPYHYNKEHVTQFRIAQDIYFDAATNTFNTRILAIAPIQKIYRENGTLKYSFPLFWIVYDDDFLEKG